MISSLENSGAQINLDKDCYSYGNLYSYEILVSDKLIEKVKSHAEAKRQCLEYFHHTGEINQFQIDCVAQKDHLDAIKMRMSKGFLNQYDDYDQAKHQCWWLNGLEDDPSDYKVLFTAERAVLVEEHVVHNDHYDGYFLREAMELEEHNIESSKFPTLSEIKLEKIGPVNIDLVDPVICTFSEEPGVRLKVGDARSFENISCDITIEVTNKKGVTEKINNKYCEAGFIDFLHEKPGLFNITVRAPGYSTWQTNNLEISRGECHVGTHVINILLDSSESN